MSRKLAWTTEAWLDYLYWQGQDKKTSKRINRLILDPINPHPRPHRRHDLTTLCYTE